MEVYVLINKKTGKFWKKKSANGRRGVNAYMSVAKAQGTLDKFHPSPEPDEVEIKKFVAEDSETITISKEEYLDLYKDRVFLIEMDAAGVDNWEGFDYVDRDRVDETVEIERKRINET